MPIHEINSIHRSIKQAEMYLSQHDITMAALIDQYGPCTLYDKSALIHKPPFHVLVWAIINQQLSVASARSIEARLASHHHGNTFRLATIDRLSDSQLKKCGLSRQKIRYLRALCSAITKRDLNLKQLPQLSNENVAEKLIRLPGIGPWTIDMFLMFYLARLDVIPLGDLALRKAIEKSYNLDLVINNTELEVIIQRWQPYGTVASWYLWCVID